MSDNPATYEVLIKQYLRLILDISAVIVQYTEKNPVTNRPHYSKHILPVL